MCEAIGMSVLYKCSNMLHRSLILKNVKDVII